jgi:hypothetical protein
MTTAPERNLAYQITQTIIASSLRAPSTNAAFNDTNCVIDYLPRYEAKDLEAIRIAVAPRGRSTSLATRNSVRMEIPIQIAVMQACQPIDAVFPMLIDLVGDLDILLARAHVIADVAAVTRYGYYLRSEINPYDIATLEQHGVFRAIITTTYQYLG